MNDSSTDKPKIIVDEDWKTQVEREREEQRQTDETGTSETPTAEMPPASFPFLITSLVTQIMAALGQLPDPISNERKVSLPYAKLNIDLLEVLQEKTKGNLTTDESQMLEDALHQLRMLYVTVKEHGGVPPELKTD